jgi:beta-glucosidase
MRTFPDSFLWGAATSAYQIEGSPMADGSGASIWHAFAHEPGAIMDGATGDVACDHYLRFEEDVRLMHELGLNSYRFGISWSRIFPEGRGRLNPAGLDFYKRLADKLAGYGIVPCATLYHWDLPLALEEKGGWLNRDVAGWFADYAHNVFRALDDRVPLWTTISEPWVVMDAGYVHGVHAPGHRSVAEAPLIAHNLLLAHASAVEAYRADGHNEIGIVINLEPKYADTEWPADVQATERAHAYTNQYFLDPIFKGEYPEEMSYIFGEAWPHFPEGDLPRIRQNIDFVGINYYKLGVVAGDPQAVPTSAREVVQPHFARTEMGWPVYPQGLKDMLVWFRQRYGEVPLYITETGAAFHDPEKASGSLVEDPLRCEYYRDHLRAALEVLDQGINLKGFFARSLLDGFEWNYGYTRRFGLIHVDFATQQRTLKASARFYAEVIRSRGACLEEW